MIFECCIYKKLKKMCVAKPVGWEWSPLEKIGDFEIVTTGDIQPEEEDFEVTLDCSCGLISVNASDISSTLVTGNIDG